jgi:transposase InsO family protein
VPATAVQEALRRLFEQWGRPQRIRVDNGTPWATWADLPAALALWWIGLGIEPIFNHPARPTENPKVERCNGLVGDWGDPQTCGDWATWEAQVAWAVRVQREQYETAAGCTRLAAYPALAHSSRGYRSAEEARVFDLERVKQHLGQGRWPRKVSKIGQITLYGKAYRVGREWRRENVWLSYDAGTSEWVITNAAGEELIRHAAEQITAEKICNLQVAHPRPPSRKKKRTNLAAHTPAQPYSA